VIPSDLLRAHREAVDLLRALAPAGTLPGDRLAQVLAELDALGLEWETAADRMAELVGECPSCGGEVVCARCGEVLVEELNR
jgi:hypothetical protein